MQRRAAATYAAIFILVAAGAYAAIGLAHPPAVTVDNPDYSLSIGDHVAPAGGITYTVGSIKPGSNQGNDLRSTTLTWTNQSAQYTASVGNNTTVSAASVVWGGQRDRHTATVANGSTIQSGGTTATVTVAGGESPAQFTLATGGSSNTYGRWDTLDYQGHQATVTGITAQRVTLAWGEPYRVLASPTAQPARVTFEQDLNVSARLAADPAVEDQTVTRADGQRYVVYTANGSTELLSSYLPTPETHDVVQGGTLRYKGNQTTVASVTNKSVTLTWRGPRTNSLSLEEGDTHTFGGTQYVAHFPDNGTVELTSNVDGYNAEVEAVNYYHERINGFWGILYISSLAAVVLLGAAYLPSRY